MSTPIYPMPAMTTQSARMYQQTYLDRNRMVTDVFVQEQYSHSSWSMATPSPVYIQQPPVQQQGNYMGTMAYMAMPGMHYYAASSASMNAYGQGHVYSARASATTTSCNMGGFYLQQFQAGSGGPNPAPKQFCATQTQTTGAPKRSCDVGTQADLGQGDFGVKKLKMGVQDSSERSDESNSSSSFDSGAGDGIRREHGMRRNSEVVLVQQRLLDMTNLALFGSEIAERLANTHRNRPCFKKIDTLCARLKQDLLRPDGVLPNINSQGIAWAVKDFIFVFTRIINAWVILKGYVYNTPEGLNKIKDELPRGFISCFDEWQCSTLELVGMIIKSFDSLESMLQKQKNCFVKDNSGPISANVSLNSSNSLREINDSTNSGRQPLGPTGNVNANANSSPQGNGSGSLPGTGTLNGSVYANNKTGSPNGNNSSGNGHDNATEGQENPGSPTSMAAYKTKGGVNLNYLYTMIEDSEETQRNVNANGTYLKTGTYQPLQKDAKQAESSLPMPPPPPPPPPKQCEQISKTQTQLPWKGQIGSVSTQKTPPMIHRVELDEDVSMDPPINMIGQEIARQLYDFSGRILKLEHVERFFQKRFTRNYYPDFYNRCQDEFIDVRGIVLRCESASYNHLQQAIHDLRRIVFVGRCYLQIFVDDDLRHYINLYERSVNEMLSEPPHAPNQFDHIMGKPGEKLFVYEI
ncbi:hypothetical protein KR018_001566 [Drosophila ironensis]|nr:hypothetical protein KR018_001566 [Drosophila ironensis]